MTSRREFIFAAFASVGAMTGLPSCSSRTNVDSYENVAERTWRHGKVAAAEKGALLRELVRYATLAPSSHNTQCWKFRLEADAISIWPDLSRRCPAVDPDDHHLFVSLGCAAENLIQAALANGLMGHVGFHAAGGMCCVWLWSRPAPSHRRCSRRYPSVRAPAAYMTGSLSSGRNSNCSRRRAPAAVYR